MVRRNALRPGLILILLFVLSRVVYYLLGVRFDSSPLQLYDQILDPMLLREHLWQSLLYLHSQPPLFNMILGVVLKIFPDHSTLAFHLLWMLMGLGIAFSLFHLMRRLRVSPTISLVLASLFIISPACIVYENLLFYTYPITLLLCLSAFYLNIYFHSHQQADGIISFLLMAMVMLIRSSYHLLWFVAALTVILAIHTTNRRRIILASALPFAIVLALYGKNAMLFGSFSGSSWLGANIHAMTTWQVPRTERAEMVAQKKLSPLALIDDPFAPLDTFRALGFARKEPTGIPVLDQEMKSTGAPNNNNLAYIAISKEYGKNAMYVLRHQPQIYAATALKAYTLYCFPETDVWEADSNRSRIVPADRAFNAIGGQLVYTESYTTPASDTAGKIHRFLQTDLLAFLGIPALLLFGMGKIYRGWRRRTEDAPYATTLGYIVITLLYSISVSILFSVSENSRYRFEVDPLLLTLFGIALQGSISRWRSRRGGPAEIV